MALAIFALTIAVIALLAPMIGIVFSLNRLATYAEGNRDALRDIRDLIRNRSCT